MGGDGLKRLQHIGGDRGEREVGDRIAAGLVQEDHVLAVGDPFAAEPHPHPSSEGLGEQEALGQWVGNQEASDRRGTEGSLLPGQAHGFVLSSGEGLRRHRRVLG
jgi:hypothetical protein